VDAVSTLVGRAVARIDAGYLSEHSVAELAGELEVSDRHLRRAMTRELGVTPVALAQSRRLALAKRLLQDTSLTVADVAFSSGFGSVRRFNAAFSAHFGRAPSQLRSERAGPGLSLRLDYRPPLHWERLTGFLGGRAIPGVERVADGAYHRVVHLGGATGVVSVSPDPKRHALVAEIAPSLLEALKPLVRALRRMFDLDARPDVIAGDLSTCPIVGPLVARWPGLRVPGTVDAFETTVRTILGQQVSVKGATTISGRLVQRFGTPLEAPAGGLTHRFPTASELAQVPASELATIGLPGKRAEAVVAAASAFAGGLDVESGAANDVVEALMALPGIGDWTAQYLAMRALRHCDAFPANDLGIRKALGGVTAREARTMSERWRPWRSYAVMALWASLTTGE